MPKDGQVDYVELGGKDLAAIKKFYETVCGWTFTDYGPGYTSFADGSLTGGFRTDWPPSASGALIVLYANDIAAMERKVQAAGGAITERHEFPGGKRFHFRDPAGNLLAVWTDKV